MKRIYLDYAATTPVDERVINVMLPYFKEKFGNPSSVHGFGQISDSALDKSRRSIAANLGAAPSEIVFTSCGSESDNLAIRGTAFSRRKQFGFNHILISPIEHPAVQATADQLSALHGFEVSYLPVDQLGLVDREAFVNHLREDTALVSIMAANNEIGTINHLPEISEICRNRGIPLHTDAVQYGAHHEINVDTLGVDLISLGAHKFYGPKGVGVLYVRSGTELLPTQTGGSQEFGFRAATENIPLIVGMAEAYRLVQEEGPSRREHLIPLRNQIINFVLDEIPASLLTGSSLQHRLPNHASFVFEDLDGNLLVQVLDSEGFACSSGSACKTGDPKPSSVLTSLGYEPSWALGSLRVTLGKDTTQKEVDQFLEILPECIRRVREVSS
ncbi:MAG: cysteine desulfurase NifS [Chloroflexota bacterium]|nr:MAG: cysteine desulfurase NifS [Chloroflexota bacterium]